MDATTGATFRVDIKELVTPQRSLLAVRRPGKQHDQRQDANCWCVMAAWMMFSVSLRPIPIDFEWKESALTSW